MLEESLPDGREDLTVDSPRLFEANLDFCRVNVHVDLIAGHVNVKKGDGIAAREEKTPVSLLDRMAERTVPDKSAIRKRY